MTSRSSVSRVGDLAGSILIRRQSQDAGALTRLGPLRRPDPEVSRVRGYGDFVHYHLLARGALDVVVESDVHILDVAALTVIVREAGGMFTDLRGGPVGLDTTTVLATNGALHPAVHRELSLD